MKIIARRTLRVTTCTQMASSALAVDVSTMLHLVSLCCWKPRVRRIFFKFLNNRKINFKKLKNVVFDHGCGTLIREPAQFAKIRFLVDGSHWQSQKKFRKTDSRQKGHLGCSSGYNYMMYKPHLPPGSSSQGREQMHSVLDKLSKSLRTKNYFHFMSYLKIFFCCEKSYQHE